MSVYVVTVQGRFVEVFLDENDANALKHHLYMTGEDGAQVTHKTI